MTGKELVTIRNILGWNQVTFAKVLGTSRRRLGNAEHGDVLLEGEALSRALAAQRIVNARMGALLPHPLPRGANASELRAKMLELDPGHAYV